MSRICLSLFGIACWISLATQASAVEYFGGDHFTEGLSPSSAWEDILKTKRIYVQFPFIGFERRFVPLQGVCVGEDGLHPVDASRNGPAREPGHVRFVVDVYRQLDTLNAALLFLFQKPWDLRPCESH